MAQTSLPKLNMDNSETQCCPRFDPTGWDGLEVEFHERPFVRATTVNFMHVPLNMGSMIKRTWKKIQDAGAAPEDEWLLLSTDPSPWRGEHYFAVTKEVPNAQMVKLTGRYLTKVFEGPYSKVRCWVKEMNEFVQSRDQNIKKMLFYYTTCPKCAKKYGKNYVVLLAQVE